MLDLYSLHIWICQDADDTLAYFAARRSSCIYVNIGRFPQCIWTTGRLVCLTVKKTHEAEKLFMRFQ